MIKNINDIILFGRKNMVALTVRSNKPITGQINKMIENEPC